MKTHSHYRLYSLLLALAATPGTARAADPEAVPRYFGELTATGSACVDWQSEGSRRIVAHAGGNFPEVIRFGSPVDGVWFPSDFAVHDDEGNLIIDLAGSTWVQVPLLHIADSGADQVQHVYWLVDAHASVDGANAPTTGLTAATGPDGDVYRFVVFRMAQIPSSDSFHPGRYYVSAAGNLQFCVSAGLFNK